MGAVLGWSASAAAQSAADLSPRVVVDGALGEYRAVEAAFHDAVVCEALGIVPCVDEEPADDSSWSSLQDIEQIVVTWDAERLIVGVAARIAGHALVVFLDHRSGGLVEASNLSAWRRALHFGPDLRPDAFVAVHDGARLPELYRVIGSEALEKIDPERYDGVATFEADAAGRALEIAIPWSVLFPNAPHALNPDSLAPAQPMFVLPADSSVQGLRLAAVVVHAADGWGAADVAPDASHAVALEPREPLRVDRAVHVDWDASGAGSPRFVDFGAAIQLQAAGRFVPEPPSSPVQRFALGDLQTFRSDRPETPSRALFPEADVDLGFTFEVSTAPAGPLFVTTSIYSMRGEHIADLVRDEARTCTPQPSPYGCFGAPASDRWDGRDRRGARVPGGMYVLRVTAGLRRGSVDAQVQRTIAVVD